MDFLQQGWDGTNVDWNGEMGFEWDESGRHDFGDAMGGVGGVGGGVDLFGGFFFGGSGTGTAGGSASGF